MKRFVSGLLLTCLLASAGLGNLVGLTACASGPRPVAPVPCVVPAFHVQAPCAGPNGDDLPCLLTEFALTLQAEQQVAQALRACPEIRLR